MSEVDRLSQSGLYPALPIADRPNDNGHPGKPPRQQPLAKADPEAADHADPASPRPPKSIIDEYA
jgi:hypothetical protein